MDLSRPASPASACGAPSASMYFAPDGQVRACCVNTEYTLGRVGPQTIREIWEGARISALRNALEGRDYSLGCQDCEHRVAAGDRAWSTAEQYDSYVGVDPGEFPRRMDFILSISCNLQCAMCDGELSSSIRLHREKRAPLPPAYGDEFFDELREFLPHIERSVFLGGEPFVAREPQRVFDLMIEQEHQGAVQVVTNGTQWNRNVERYLRELPMSITVSIDGYTAETLEPLRVGVERDQLFENVGRYQEAVTHNGGTLSFHYCLMRQNWHEFGRFLLEADRRGASTLVMTVTGPDGFSLWDLPEPGLRHVLESMEREDQDLANQLVLNREVWNAELARLRRHLAAIEDGHLPEWVNNTWTPSLEVPVMVGDGAGAADDGASWLDPFDVTTADLQAWAHRPPVVLVVVDGVIDSVQAGEWATPLTPQGWIGIPIASLAGHLGAILGAPSTPDPKPTGGQVSVGRMTFDADSTSIEFRSAVAPGPGAGHVQVAFVTDADLTTVCTGR